MKTTLFSLLGTLVLILAACKGETPDVINSFQINQITLTEADQLKQESLTVSLDGTISSEISVAWRLQEKTARFTQDIIENSGTLTFGPDQLSTTLLLDIVGDSHLELGESFDLILTYAGKDYPITLLIEDNDPMEAILSDNDGFLTPETYPSMERVWQDEFDGSALNTNDWTYELGNGCDVGICGWDNNELEVYTNDESNIKLENGFLTITAVENNGNYTSARIKTEDKVELRYGRIDIRAKLPKGQGIWPALWMLGANISDVGWPVCGEIDIMELVGHQPATTHGTVHYDDSGYKYNSSSKALSTGDFSDKFHVFSIVWDRDEIVWYLDNVAFKTFGKNNVVSGYPFNADFYFIMNLAVGGNWPGNPDASTVFPQQMLVDYVRVFQ